MLEFLFDAMHRSCARSEADGVMHRSAEVQQSRCKIYACIAFSPCPLHACSFVRILCHADLPSCIWSASPQIDHHRTTLYDRVADV